MILFLSLYIHCHTQAYYQVLFVYILQYVSKSFLSLALKKIMKSFMHNGLISSLSLYPITYLNELFLPYDSFLEINILLTSSLSI